MIKLLVKLPIFKRIIPSIIKKLNISNFQYKNESLIYELDLRYLVDRRFYLFGYDKEVINYLNHFIKEKKIDYFLDIGSCWGIYSLQIGHKNPEIKVFAFDVFEKNIERLKRMAKINRINNIKLFNNAIGNEKGVKIFSVNEKYSPNFSKDLNGKYQIKVYQNKLDNLLNFSNKKIVIKIDVERSELEALKGAENLLRKNKCLIILETNKNSPTIKYLLNMQYKVIQINLLTSDVMLTNYN
jgi:FkbM family methyltransferase